MNYLTWATDALGKDGITYRLIVWALPILPMSMILFVWYILFNKAEVVVMPLWIKIFVSTIVLVFLHQEVEILRLLRAARKTAKQIKIDDKGHVELVLFSNKEIKLESFGVVDGVEQYERSSIYYRLLPKDGGNISIVTPTETYYISGTTHGVEDLKANLLRICHKDVRQ